MLIFLKKKMLLAPLKALMKRMLPRAQDIEQKDWKKIEANVGVPFRVRVQLSCCFIRNTVKTSLYCAGRSQSSLLQGLITISKDDTRMLPPKYTMNEDNVKDMLTCN